LFSNKHLNAVVAGLKIYRDKISELIKVKVLSIIQ